MYVIFDRLQRKYYSGMKWEQDYKHAEKLTKPRAEELVESLKIRVSRGMASGDYIIVDLAKLATDGPNKS